MQKEGEGSLLSPPDRFLPDDEHDDHDDEHDDDHDDEHDDDHDSDDDGGLPAYSHHMMIIMKTLMIHGIKQRS